MKKEVIEALGIAVQAQIPVLLWGGPGIGKTASIYALGEALGRHVEVVIVSHHDPADLNGLPYVVDGETRMALPSWARRLMKAGGGILFLDEISTAPPAVQAAALRLIREQVVGEVRLEGVSVVAAANPPEQAADGWDLAPPTANRFVHLQASLDLEAWSMGLVGGWGTPAVPRLSQGWKGDVPRWGGMVAGFLKRRPELSYRLPKEASRQGFAWPSPRTWEMAATLLAAGEAAGASRDALHLLLAGAVGDEAAVEFWTWLQAQDLPDPEELLADPARYSHPHRGDLAYAVLMGVAAAVKRQPTRERYEAAWKVLGKAAEVAADVALAPAKLLVEVGRAHSFLPPKEVEAFRPLVQGVSRVVEAK